MPPRHATPQMQSALHAAAPLRYGLIAFCLLMAPGVTRVHAQSMPPAVTAPADPFHQPCVAIHASPDAHGRPRVLALRDVIALMAAANAIVRKQSIDLDDRCTMPPAFAPTRDTDSTNVWYADALADDRHATSRHSGTSVLHGLMS
ncbi:hypothetical protein PHO31112_03427 [Pandoraea horticolens]|uniref:Uncharacterized protein n=2 Tax=Pandoraea horticolens TaxID=2508298 RepID=A0A5E4WTF9_9BURK|nr:hypothetical protein PHO31112_03427 [Pandoraea horticolens]